MVLSTILKKIDLATNYAEYIQATYNVGASTFITEERSTQELKFIISIFRLQTVFQNRRIEDE